LATRPGFEQNLGRDSENTIAFESDGTFFRYTELDDYVVELSGCAPVPQQCHRDS
jgi:hypothetical protein